MELILLANDLSESGNSREWVVMCFLQDRNDEDHYLYKTRRTMLIRLQSVEIILLCITIEKY